MDTTLSERISPPDWVNMVARREPERPCFVRPDATVVTYGEVRDAIHRLASAMATASREICHMIPSVVSPSDEKRTAVLVEALDL
jgi:hypothetical protein